MPAQHLLQVIGERDVQNGLFLIEGRKHVEAQGELVDRPSSIIAEVEERLAMIREEIPRYPISNAAHIVGVFAAVCEKRDAEDLAGLVASVKGAEMSI